jgi:hypothetical protein
MHAPQTHQRGIASVREVELGQRRTQVLRSKCRCRRQWRNYVAMLEAHVVPKSMPMTVPSLSGLASGSAASTAGAVSARRPTTAASRQHIVSQFSSSNTRQIPRKAVDRTEGKVATTPHVCRGQGAYRTFREHSSTREYRSTTISRA